MKHLHQNQQIRNIAIIAHVDHGKTTLLDHMLRQSGAFRANQLVEERVMDQMDLERERGITIAAKNCSIFWKDVKINIVDTPGHADFGGEVERALMMVDGALLLVDAAEGPLPQTRFVLAKALHAGLKIIVVINKIDRSDSRPREVLNEVYDLFIDLDASDEQMDFPVFYSVGIEGIAQDIPDGRGPNLHILLDAILAHVPPPTFDPDEPLQMLVCDLDYSDFLGRLAIGRIFNGTAAKSDPLVCLDNDGNASPLTVTRLQVYEGLNIREVDSVQPGDIALLAGIENVLIGDTICSRQSPKALARVAVDEPTVSMLFTVNTSPLSGLDGDIVQSRKLRERLFKETLRNVAVTVEDAPTGDGFIVKGRGEFQMAILIETMRREDFELTVGRPQVIMKKKDGKPFEPIEHLSVDCEETFQGIVIQRLSRRRGRVENLVNHGSGRVRLELSIPTRGLIGYRDDFLTDTRGTGIMNSYLVGYEEYRGDFRARVNGSLVADRPGVAVPYALYNLEPRGILFIGAGERVYEGMIVGEHNRDNDLAVNPTRTKKLTNMRAAGKDEAVVLTPVVPMTLERAIAFINDDEMVEVTPRHVRLRKTVLKEADRIRIRRAARSSD